MVSDWIFPLAFSLWEGSACTKRGGKWDGHCSALLLVLLHFNSTRRRFLDGMAGLGWLSSLVENRHIQRFGGCAHRIERQELVGKLNWDLLWSFFPFPT